MKYLSHLKRFPFKDTNPKGYQNHPRLDAISYSRLRRDQLIPCDARGAHPAREKNNDDVASETEI